MIKNGLLSRDDLTAELADVVTGRVEGRSSPAEIIIVRTEGLASQDIALSHWAFTEASRRDLLQYVIPGPVPPSSIEYVESGKLRALGVAITNPMQKRVHQCWLTRGFAGTWLVRLWVLGPTLIRGCE